MKKFFFALVLLATFLTTQAQEPYAIVPKHYGLVLTVDYEKEKLIGMCELTLTNNSTQQVDSISFLLYRLMKVTDATDSSDQDIQYTQYVTDFDDFGQLQINQIYIYKTLQAGESTTIKLYYNGYLLGYSETGMRYIKDRISPSFTFIRFDTYAYPYPCLPNTDVLRLSAGNKFDYSVTVNVPDSLVAVCGGKLVALLKENGIATYEYNSKLPAWRIDIAIADYKQIGNSWINIFYFGREEAAQRIANKGNNCINLYRRWWGELQAYSALTLIETEEGSGGQTDETTILLPSEAFNRDDSFEYLYHELSHLWNVPIREPQGMSPRWEEGLATFCQILASEKLGDNPDGYTKERTNAYISWFNDRITRNELLKNTPLINYGNENITEFSYMQAMIMFSVLYYWLGENTFNNLIGGFHRQYYESGASTKTFTDYCIKHGKEKRLKAFFDDWMYTIDYIKHIGRNVTVDSIVTIYKR